ncbi:hypothetical protein [Streptomyces sp. NPDC054804]
MAAAIEACTVARTGRPACRLERGGAGAGSPGSHRSLLPVLDAVRVLTASAALADVPDFAALSRAGLADFFTGPPLPPANGRCVSVVSRPWRRRRPAARLYAVP